MPDDYDGEELINTATVTSEEDPEGDTATWTLISPDLEITKGADKDSANAGDEVSYTLTVAQTVEGATAKNVTLC